MKDKRRNLIFFIIIALGIAVRLFFIFKKDIFIDEVLYSQVSLLKNIPDLIKSNHTIPDHGPLFSLF